MLLLSVFQPLMALSPVLEDLRQTFGVDASLAQQLISIPSIVAVPVMLLCGRLSRRLPGKPVLMTGLALLTFAGVATSFAPSFTVFFVLRALSGAGAGLLIPYTLSLIADNFEGPERNTLYGLQGTALNSGGVIFSLLGGLVGVLGWRANAWTAVLGVPFLLLAYVGLPHLPPSAHAEEKSGHLTPAAWRIYLTIVASQALIWVFPPSAAFLLDQRGFAGSALAGTAMAFFTAGGILGGIAFSPIHRRIGRHVTGSAFALGAAGLAVAALVPAYGAFLAGALLLGLCGSFSVSCLLVDLTAAVPGASMTTTMSFAMAFLVGGNALGPVLSGALRSALPGLTYEILFVGSAACLALLAAASFLPARNRQDLKGETP